VHGVVRCGVAVVSARSAGDVGLHASVPRGVVAGGAVRAPVRLPPVVVLIEVDAVGAVRAVRAVLAVDDAAVAEPVVGFGAGGDEVALVVVPPSPAVGAEDDGLAVGTGPVVDALDVDLSVVGFVCVARWCAGEVRLDGAVPGGSVRRCAVRGQVLAGSE